MANTPAYLSAIITANNTKFKQGLAGAKASMKGFGKSINKMGAGLTPFLGVTAGIAGLTSVMRGAGRTIMDFEQSMADVKSITRATDEEFKQLEDSAKKLGGSTKFTASEVAQLQKEYAKLGFTTEEILKASEATLDLAAATGSELAEAAEVAGTTIRGFGLDAAEAGRVTDLMARSFTSSALDLEKFKESMKYVAPVARAAGVSIEETTAMLSVLADAGISGSMAGTSLKKIMSELGSEGGTLSEKLRDLSSKGITLANAQDEVGERAKTALLVLGKQIDTIPKLTEAYNNAKGAAKEMATVQLDTLRGSLAILKSSYEGLILTIADEAGGTGNLKGAVDLASDALQTQSQIITGEKGGKGVIKAFQDLMLPMKAVLDYNVGLYTSLKNQIPLWRQLKKLTGDKEWTGSAGSFGGGGTDEKDGWWNAWDGQDGGLFGSGDKNVKIPAKLRIISDFDMTSSEWGEIASDVMGFMFSDDLYNDGSLMMQINADLAASFRELSNNTPEDVKSLHDAIKLQFRGIKDESESLSDVLAVAFSQIGSSFAESMGQVAAGTQDLKDTLEDIGAMILQAAGDIMIMAGLKMIATPQGVALVLGGLALKGFGSFVSAGGFSGGGSSGSSFTPIPTDKYFSTKHKSILYGNDIKTSSDHATDIYNRVG
jgi:ABC-type transporter Mla subunit MlaD